MRPHGVPPAEACTARLVLAMLPNNFFQILASGRSLDSATPQVFPTECQ
ncbi:hypothetical protein GGD68_006732 [Paraburkholderia fungorum]|uniref:Uncharacterized protein n=1 Tax=Paraburkholderia fungorum TaxID=134537 RepID=A0AAW3V5P2_9BURK|nr:hypothetical protein [Paraburkholderia fungorum]MBB6205898.1 hypothetical protein [Paraburkholderia fungorum]